MPLKANSWTLPAGAIAIAVVAAIAIWLTGRNGDGTPAAPSVQELSRQVVVAIDKPIEDQGRPLRSEEWIDADKEGIRQADMFVRLDEIKADRLPEKDAAPYLLINFKLSDNKLERKNAFAGFGKGKAEPKLSDAAGRPYAFLGHRPRKLRNKFDMGVNEDLWLIFELPAAGAAPLKLEVPASAWGREGVCRFEIKTVDPDETPEIPKLIAKYKALLHAPQNAPPDLALGRMHFTKTCMECHVLFGHGAKIGPELTELKFPDGRLKRSDLDFLAANIVDPSLEIAKEFTPTVVITKDGKVFLGLVKEQTAQSVTLQTSSRLLELKRGDIEEMKESKISLMPTGLLKDLNDYEVRALFAYVMSPRQTPVLATHENRGYFFTERDPELSHFWHALGGVWRKEGNPNPALSEIRAPGPASDGPALLASYIHIADDFRIALQFAPGAGGSGAILLRQADEAFTRERGPRIAFAAGKLDIQDRKGASVPVGKDVFVQPAAWNKLEIIGVGSRLEIRLNGKEAATLDDPPGRRYLVLEGPASAGQDVRFRDFDLHLLTAKAK